MRYRSIRHIPERLRPEAQGRRSKYGAIRCVVDGIRFDSQMEARRYMALRQEERDGSISGLRCHVRFALFDPGGTCKGEYIGTYRADFVYLRNGRLVVEDVKSTATARRHDWKRTKSLMRACHGIDVVEVFRA